MISVGMRSAERQSGTHVLSEKQKFIVKDDLKIIWKQLGTSTREPPLSLERPSRPASDSEE